MNIGIERLFVTSISICTVLALLVSGCGTLLSPSTTEPEPSSVPAPAQTTNETAPPPPEQSGNKGVDLPPIEDPEKGNPKLDSFLNGLILAEERGEAESFAQSANVKVVDGKVRVVIECVPGQVEAAAEAATSAGAELGLSYRNLLQAVVPITSLTALAEAESIRFIGLPVPPDPAASN